MSHFLGLYRIRYFLLQVENHITLVYTSCVVVYRLFYSKFPWVRQIQVPFSLFTWSLPDTTGKALRPPLSCTSQKNWGWTCSQHIKLFLFFLGEKYFLKFPESPSNTLKWSTVTPKPYILYIIGVSCSKLTKDKGWPYAIKFFFIICLICKYLTIFSFKLPFAILVYVNEDTDSFSCLSM